MSRRSRMDGAAWLAKRRKHTAPKVCRHDGVRYVSAFEPFQEHCPACGVRTCRVMRPEGIRTEELRIVAPEDAYKLPVRRAHKGGGDVG